MFRSSESSKRLEEYNNDLAKLNRLLESNQSEYCEVYCRQKLDAAESRFKLSKDLLDKLVYGKELSLSGNFLQQTVGRRLNDKDMPQLVDFLLEDNTVCQLNLPYNDFGDEGLLKLAEALLIRGDILFVNIAHNNLTPAGCLEFVQYLMQRKPLHSFKLSGMKIGPEGFNGLICLVMCGRGPYDLDVGDTDMDVASFQGLCSAWEAIDRDEDFPKYLTLHPLPISLDILAQMKVAYDDSKREENLIQSRRSLMHLLDPKYSQTESFNARPSDKVSFPQLENGASAAEIPEDEGQLNFLQGLFEIPQVDVKLKTDPLPKIARPLRLTKDEFQEVQAIIDESQALPDTSEVVEAYKKITNTGCEAFDETGKAVLICPSLYSLDLDDAIDLTDEGRNDAGQGDGFIVSSTLEKIIEHNQTNRPLRGTPDEKHATRAANTLINRAIQEAAQLSCTTDYEEKSDVSQLLLSILLDTCQKVRDWEDSESEFYVEDLELIWNVATEQTLNLVEQRGAYEQCNVTEAAMTGFVKTFMENTKRTMLHMLRNPHFPGLLMDVGTKSCRDAVYEDKTKLFQPTEYSTPMDPQNIRRIVKSFVEGAVLEAAQLIGSGDPFSFRRRDEPLRDAFAKSKSVCEQVEGNIDTVVDDFFLAGALLSRDAVDVVKRIEDEQERMTRPASIYVDGLFDQLAKLLIATEEMNRNKELRESETVLKFPHISRPTRLVLNRPLFRDYEIIMSQKLGDFLQDNESVKCLHMRKWDMGEDGMINLMEGLQLNTSLVLLDLGCNCIGPEGTKLLANFVQNNSSLKHLILNHNRLRDPGMRCLVGALLNSNVTFLNVSYNDVTDIGLDILFEALPRTNIRSLYAIGNHFSQNTWKMAEDLFDSQRLLPEECDFTIQEVDGQGIIVKNAQIRDTNEWYEVPPAEPNGLKRAPYFDENAHLNFRK